MAAVDPRNAQLQQDVAEVRGNIGEMLTRMGDPANAIEQLNLSVGALEKMTGADKPQSPVGLLMATDQFWLGKAHALMASRVSTRQKLEHCREARSWFQKALAAYESVGDHVGSDNTGAARVAEICREMIRCGNRPETMH